MLLFFFVNIVLCIQVSKQQCNFVHYLSKSTKEKENNKRELKIPTKEG